MKRTVLVGLISAALMVGPVSSYAANDDVATISLKGILSEGRLYAPLRITGEKLGAVVSWNQETNTASLTKDGKTFTATVGNGALLISGKVHVQFKALSNFFYPNDYIKWNKSTMTGTSEHIEVRAYPLTDEQAIKFATKALDEMHGTQKREWNKFLINLHGLMDKEIQWNSSYTQYTASFYDSRGENRNEIITEMTKKGNDWIMTSFKSLVR
ncbi:copper amine oxidase N-terminal domain-containing protein [Paenibacillus sp. PR3]|uniref:Copper amine oxidase N-terminal domain-containing protein n=1 Tax=Paenibacillus terricola TaxID=2763503 RepID=A0ABR8N789_9BACL|nr:copper amine oxidase N-terminal domain-containing protein [Paenibacillus terricola]MBD3922709.1 copper amine oxidase N-terminal domain-containing protein [Paenibacillus terricola]